MPASVKTLVQKLESGGPDAGASTQMPAPGLALAEQRAHGRAPEPAQSAERAGVLVTVLRGRDFAASAEVGSFVCLSTLSNDEDVAELAIGLPPHPCCCTFARPRSSGCRPAVQWHGCRAARRTSLLLTGSVCALRHVLRPQHQQGEAAHLLLQRPGDAFHPAILPHADFKGMAAPHVCCVDRIQGGLTPTQTIYTPATRVSQSLPVRPALTCPRPQAHGAERRQVQGQDVILFITVHSAQEVGEDRSIGSLRVPLSAGFQTHNWFELSPSDPNAKGGSLELSILYSGVGDPDNGAEPRLTKMTRGSGVGAADGPIGDIKSHANLVWPMDTESFPELSDLSAESPLPSLPSTCRPSPVHENHSCDMSPITDTMSNPWAEPDTCKTALGTDKERPSTWRSDETEGALQNAQPKVPDEQQAHEVTAGEHPVCRLSVLCPTNGVPNDTKTFTDDSNRQCETAAIPASSFNTGSLSVNMGSLSAPTHVNASTYDARAPEKITLTHETMQWQQNEGAESIRASSSQSNAGTLKENKQEERRKDWEEMFEMRAEMDGIFSNSRQWTSKGRPWSEKKISHHSRTAPHQQLVIDNLTAKLRQTELDLMVTKEELLVEQGARIKANEACSKHLDQIAQMTDKLKEEEKTISTLKKRVIELEQCTTSEALAQERRQLRFSRILSEFVLTCLLDKLRLYCYSKATLSESCDELSGSFTAGQRLGTAELMKLRHECAKDLKALTDIVDVMNGLVSTRDNAARYCIDRAQQSIVASRHAISSLEHALVGPEREREGIRQDLQALHDDEQQHDSLEGVSHIQHLNLTSIMNNSGQAHAGINGACLDRPCREIVSMQEQISSAADSMGKTEHELRVLSRFFEQKDRTSNGVLASFIHSKHAGEAGWSIHASEPWGGMPASHDDELSVKDHHALVRELDNALLAELCSSRRLPQPQDTAQEVDRRITPRPVMPPVQEALPFKPTRSWTNISEAQMAVSENNLVDDDLPLLSVPRSDDHVTHVLLKTGDQALHAQEPQQGPASSSAARMYCPALEAADEIGTGDLERQRFFFGNSVTRTDMLDALSQRYVESLSTAPKVYTEIAASSGSMHAQFQYA